MSWQPSESEKFWGNTDPCQHLVEIYSSHPAFLDSLERFVADGLTADEAVIIIATRDHRRALGERMARRGIDLDAARTEGRYLDLDAADTLSFFMVNRWPNRMLFTHLLSDLLVRARANDRRVRAFGEMVVLLLESGQTEATVRLEEFWHELCSSERFTLLCAYPAHVVASRAARDKICGLHSQALVA